MNRVQVPARLDASGRPQNCFHIRAQANAPVDAKANRGEHPVMSCHGVHCAPCCCFASLAA